MKDLILVQSNPTSRRRAVYSHSGAISHDKIEDYGHSDGEDQSVKERITRLTIGHK